MYNALENLQKVKAPSCPPMVKQQDTLLNAMSLSAEEVELLDKVVTHYAA